MQNLNLNLRKVVTLILEGGASLLNFYLNKKERKNKFTLELKVAP